MRETLQGSLETQRAQWPGVARSSVSHSGIRQPRYVPCWPRHDNSGMDPDDVVAAGEAAGREEWVSVGAFFDEYLDVSTMLKGSSTMPSWCIVAASC